ncbi:MAG: Uncharacterised protein [Flavobacteriia bacterium]|nr:MAG: Uncharacterised protein [Flavobacteriia bacterium]
MASFFLLPNMKLEMLSSALNMKCGFICMRKAVASSRPISSRILFSSRMRRTLLRAQIQTTDPTMNASNR